MVLSLLIEPKSLCTVQNCTRSSVTSRVLLKLRDVYSAGKEPTIRVLGRSRLAL